MAEQLILISGMVAVMSTVIMLVGGVPLSTLVAMWVGGIVLGLAARRVAAYRAD